MADDRNPLIRVRNNEQINAEAKEAASKAEADVSNEQFIMSLAADLRGRWEQASIAKVSRIDTRLVRCKRARKAEYEPKKLADLKSVYGQDFEPPYPPIIASKCRDAEAWLRSNYVRNDVDIWDLQVEPMPELPTEIETKISQQISEKIFNEMLNQAMANNQPLDQQVVMKKIEDMTPLIKDKVQAKIKSQAKEALGRMKTLIETQFMKGGFDDAVKDFIFDVVTYPSAFLAGPIQKKSQVQSRKFNPDTGKWDSFIEEVIIDTYERVSPFDIYPARDAKHINDGYLFRKMTTSPKDLSDLLGVPGYSDKAIREVLTLYRKGGLHEWTNVDTSRADLEDRDTLSVSMTQKIDVLEYQGTVEGNLLLDWGLSKDEVPDGDKEYPIIAWLIGTHIIKAMLNPNPFGVKNIYKCSLIEDPDNFWGLLSLPEMLWDIQLSSCACARGILLNIAYASAPIFEYDIDAFPNGVPAVFYPGMKLPRTTSQMTTRAFEAHTVPYVGISLQQTFEFFRALADEYSGIPRRPDRAKGAGKTATGYSMQLSEESRGLQSISVNIDEVIKAIVTAQYNLNLQYEDIDLIGGANVVAKGSLVLMAKEQLAVRMKETLDSINNPTDMQIFGLEGRKKLWKAQLAAFPIDTDDILPDEALAMANVGNIVNQPQMPQGIPQQQAAQSEGQPPMPEAMPVGRTGI